MKKFFRKLIMLCAVLGVAGAPFSAAESREQTGRISIAGTNQTGTGYIVASGAAKLIDQYVDNVFATV